MTKTDATRDTSLARRRRRDKRRLFMQAFLDALRATPIVTSAVEAAMKASRYTATIGGMRKTVYRWRDRDPAFQRKWDASLEQGWDRAEGAAFQRGVEGVEEPVFGKGGQVGTKRVYSDKLLELVLKSNRAKVYGDRQKVEHEHGLSADLSSVLREIRMSRQERIEGEIARELPASEVKVLSVNGNAVDVVSTEASGTGHKPV